MDKKRPQTSQLSKHIGRLLSKSPKANTPLQMLHYIREKINDRGYRYTDMEDILGELDRLQKIIGQVNSEMIQICNLLKK